MSFFEIFLEPWFWITFVVLFVLSLVYAASMTGNSSTGIR